MVSYWDPASGKSYGLNKVTEILDPDNNRDTDDPNLMRVALKSTGYILYYHHKTQSKLYANDKVTEILNPFDYYTTEKDSSTGAIVSELVRFVSADRATTFGYYDLINNRWLAPDRTTAIANPFLNYDQTTKRIKYVSSDGRTVYGYYSTADKKWYTTADGTQEMTKNPF